MNKIGITIFIIFMAVFASFSGFIFLNNSNSLEQSIHTHTEKLKKHSEVNETLAKLLVYKSDSLKKLNEKVSILNEHQVKDSILIVKLYHEKDSLIKLQKRKK